MPVEVGTRTEKESGIITIRSSFQEYILWELERSDVFSVRKNFGVVWWRIQHESKTVETNKPALAQRKTQPDD